MCVCVYIIRKIHANMKMRQSGTTSLAMGHIFYIEKQDSQHFNFPNSPLSLTLQIQEFHFTIIYIDILIFFIQE